MHHERLPQVRPSPSGRGVELDANEEVEVVKAILLREEYVARVRQCLRDHHARLGKEHKAFADLISLLDLLRSTTVETVEAIQRWRGGQGHPKPFVWGGANYLLKIPADVDFLDGHKVPGMGVQPLH